MGEEQIRDMAANHGVPESVIREVYGLGESAGRTNAGGASTISDIRSRAGDVKLSREMYSEAEREGISLTSLLERADPSERYNDWVNDPLEPTGRRRMDAFERQMMLADIRTHADVRRGMAAHTVERFYASNVPSSEILFPEFINRTIREAQTEPTLIDEIVTMRTIIDSDVYRSFRLVESDESETRLQRVTEAAEPRRVRITGAESVVRLYKFGIALEISYETARRMSIDLFAFHIQRIARQNEVDKVSAAVQTLIEGDGNPDTAAEVFRHNADLNGDASASELQFKAWLRFLAKFRNPYNVTTVLTGEEALIELMTLNMGTANMPFATWTNLVGAGGSVNFPRPLSTNVRAYVDDNVPDDYLLAIDNRYAIQMLSEAGGSITETDKIITKQLDQVVISDITGFAVLDGSANKVLELGS